MRGLLTFAGGQRRQLAMAIDGAKYHDRGIAKYHDRGSEKALYLMMFFRFGRCILSDIVCLTKQTRQKESASMEKNGMPCVHAARNRRPPVWAAEKERRCCPGLRRAEAASAAQAGQARA